MELGAGAEVALHTRYSDPGALIVQDAWDDQHNMLVPSLLPEDPIERLERLVHWLGEEVCEVAEADHGFSGNGEHENNKRESSDVGELSYLDGTVNVWALDSEADESILDPVAQELGITRPILADRLKLIGYHVLHELGDGSWFRDQVTRYYSVDPLEAVKRCELAVPGTISYIGSLTTSGLSLLEFSDLVTKAALGTQGTSPGRRLLPSQALKSGMKVVMGKVSKLQIALHGEGERSATDCAVDLIGCSLVHEQAILAKCLNTRYSEMIYFNLLKLLGRHRQQTVSGHEPDSMETADLLRQWRPWDGKDERALPRRAILS